MSDAVAVDDFVEEAVAAAAAAVEDLPVIELEEDAYSSTHETEGVAMFLGGNNPKKRGRPPGKTNKNTVAAYLPIMQQQQQRMVSQDVTPRTVPEDVPTVPDAEAPIQVLVPVEAAAAAPREAAAVAKIATSESHPPELEGLNWEQFFYQLFVYKSSRLRSIPIALDYTVVIDNNKLCKLGAWVDMIRIEWETNGITPLPSLEESGVDPETTLSVIQLSEDRVKALNALGFTWSRTPPSASIGHPSRTMVRDRRPKKRPETMMVDGSIEGMPLSHISPMDGEKRMNKDAIWEEMYQRLVLYHARYGYCHIPPNFDETTLEDETTASFVLTRDMSLRSWVARQRSLFKGTAIAHGKPYVLKPERRLSLAALGFEQYVATGLEKGSSGSGDLNAGKTENQTIESSIITDAGGLNDIASLPPVLPAAMGGFKMRFRKNWNEYYEDLKEYKKKYNDCNVPQFWSTDRKLGKWVAKQRYQYNLKMRNEKSQLTDTRMMLLGQIGFNWGGIRVGSRSTENDADDDTTDDMVIETMGDAPIASEGSLPIQQYITNDVTIDV